MKRKKGEREEKGGWGKERKGDYREKRKRRRGSEANKRKRREGRKV